MVDLAPRGPVVTLIPESRKAQLTMLIWSLAAFVASAAAMARTAGPDQSRYVVVIVTLIAPFALVMVVGLGALSWRLMPWLLLRPVKTSQEVRAFFVRYGPGLKQTWRGLVACLLLFGVFLNLLQLLSLQL